MAMSTQNFCGKMGKIRHFLFSPKILWDVLFQVTLFGKKFFGMIHKFKKKCVGKKEKAPLSREACSRQAD